MTLDERFKALGAENAPGQELRQDISDLDTIMRGEKLEGVSVDFSHGDVDAFPPIPSAVKEWNKGYEMGGEQAYTQYRGSAKILKGLAQRISAFTGSSILADKELIITPGTQGALFLALGSTVEAGEKVAVVEPDYFANRKLVKYFNGVIVPIPLNYQDDSSKSGPDLDCLEKAFKNGTKVFVFSTPNNPTGVVYSKNTIDKIANLASIYDVTVIVDQLYSRLLYNKETYTHLCACKVAPKNIITILGPSKTESLSGFRLGVAFGASRLIERMERLQAIVSLRAAGYNQAVLNGWLKEPADWMKKRIREHEAIRDDLLKIFRSAGISTATPQAGSYLFPKLPPLEIDTKLFVQLLRYQAGVTVTSGSEFGPTTRDSIRLNFSQDHKAAVAAARRIVKIVDRYRK
ncbi:MAG: aminotransferase class I/II-fold pyridoxal phosphate-dependent enzyme [Epsilonproteobacteria bacterium]|nr:aminotransferase class I/II-fold pyridoxal phosphate-dependent enzyme [Campylobacterota bacterium]